jgi:putative ABC transport system substrate-binding protein
MRRREFITLLGGATAWPVVAWAQQSAMPVVGFIRNTSPDARLVAAFRRGLNENGYIEGQNIVVEYRWTDNERLPATVADMVRRQVSAIVTGGLPASLAGKAATTAIPIVFATGGDPVHFGLVASLNRPGGNVTGVSFLLTALIPKQLELLHELVPNATAIAFLVNPTARVTEPDTKEAQSAVRSLGLKLLVLNATSERDFEMAFATVVQQRAGGLLTHPETLFTSYRNQLVALAARHGVPAIYHLREAVEAGGLMSYGTSFTDAYRQAGIYTGRILKGEKPADLPVVQSTRFELVINLKTAKALGLEVPPRLLALADEVLE